MPKFCKNCGQMLNAKSRFCPSCGTKVEADNVPVQNADSVPVQNAEPLESFGYEGPRVRLCDDGKYRWKYEMNMLTNPAIFLTVLKVFEGIIVGIFLFFGFFFYVIHGDWTGLWGWLKTLGMMMALFFGLTLLGVLIAAAIFKGKYIVQFEMDEKEVAHIVTPEQMKKAQKLAKITAVAGAARGSFTTAGAGMTMASRNSSTSLFKNVRRVKPRRWLHVIKVNQLLNRNQIYVPYEDFDFVYNYIKSRCPKAK